MAQHLKFTRHFSRETTVNLSFSKRKTRISHLITIDKDVKETVVNWNS